MPKIVYSTTLQQASWHTTIKRAVDPDEVRALKAQPGGDMAIGGADLAASFIRHDLIDEFWQYVNPIVLGRGKPFFPPSDTRIPLQLADSRTFGNGVVLLRYERSSAPD
jgi:dihydrofolate reductase